MELTYSDLPDGIRKIDLTGRLDIEGAGAIEMKFTALTATQKSFVIVDLAGVDFLASIGIATLVRNAKAIRLRQGHMVLLNPRRNVADVLASTRIDQVVPVYSTLEDAVAGVHDTPSALL